MSTTAPGARTAAASAALRAFFKIVGRWGLSRSQAQTLLGTSESSIHRWYKDPNAAQPTVDQLERISYVLGIFDGLHRLLGDTAFAGDWVHQSNHDFGDYSPLERMLGGTVGDLAFVRTYVDRWADGW